MQGTTSCARTRRWSRSSTVSQVYVTSHCLSCSIDLGLSVSVCVLSLCFLTHIHDDQVIYNRFEARDMFCQTSARDFVLASKWTRLHDGVIIVVRAEALSVSHVVCSSSRCCGCVAQAAKSVPHERCPEDPTGKCVRGQVHLGGWIIRYVIITIIRAVV